MDETEKVEIWIKYIIFLIIISLICIFQSIAFPARKHQTEIQQKTTKTY